MKHDPPVAPARFARLGVAYGLTERQIAVLGALAATGAIGDAAAALGVSYTSARNTVAELKRKLGVATLPMMVGLALELGGRDAAAGTGARRRHDLFTLSDRQYVIARTIGVAKSRRDIAAGLRVSEAVIEAELKDIHLILGVRNAGELTRLVLDAEGELRDDAAAAEHAHDLPLGLLDDGGRTIGYSDFGPPAGSPVLVLHSTITARAPPTRLVAALRARGHRPIAIDRPGFGDTDPAPPSDDPYAAASHDAAAVCRSLGLASVQVVARGAGQAAVRLAQLHPALVHRAVLVNPTPAIAFTSTDQGPLGAVKRAFGRRPWAVDVMIRLLAAYATPERMRAGMVRSFRESPPDAALVHDDPQFVADYLRATRSFAHGRIAGYVSEQSAWAAGYEIPPLPGMTDWRIIQGRHFILHNPGQAMRYWSDKLPDTPVTWIEDAGQMLAYSHAEAVAALLAS